MAKRKAKNDSSGIPVKKAIKHHSSDTSILSQPSSSSEAENKYISPNLLHTIPGVSDAIKSYNKACKSVQESTEMEIPESVSILKFAQCRAREIASLVQDVKTKRPKLHLQQLPHYMRRRAASHHVNRVPRRLREKALKEVQKAKKTKRPSRKYRRRPSNLLMEYIRRQRKYTWLETHIWFAKRFKMTKLCGYVIPLYPNDKSIRAGFKASSRYVLLQDLSYMCCIQLVGPEQKLLEKLSHLTNNSTGLTFASKMYLSGTREGTVVLYNPNSFPFCALGPVSFLWKPSSDTKLRRLWIWCHPVMHDKLVDILKILFDLINSQELSNEVTPSQYNQLKSDSSEIQDHVDTTSENEVTCGKINDDNLNSNSSLIVQDKKLNYRFRRTTTYSKNDISLTLLKDALVRHRLVGPKSQAVIADALKPADVHYDTQQGDIKWWGKYYYDDKKHLFEKQIEFWSCLQKQTSPDNLPPKIVLGLTIKDPRLDLPRMKKSVSSEFNDGTNLGVSAVIDSDLSDSPLWVESIRDEVTATKMPESKVNQMRSQFLVPGTRLELGREEARIPIIIIQQPGVNGFSSGWDIISPLGWSMPLWIAFIYRGARAFGLRQLRSVSKEAGVPLFPFNYPDTDSGKDWIETQRKIMMEKHFRYPPAKRPSFQKLGILTPYFMPNNVLVSNWIKHVLNLSLLDSSSKESSFFVIRMKKELRQLQEICELLNRMSKLRSKNNTYHNIINKYLQQLESKILNTDLKYALVCIKIKCFDKGRPRDYSGIYMPDDTDLMTVKTNSQFKGLIEPIHDAPKVHKEKRKKRKRKKESAKLSTDISKKKENKEDDTRLLRPNIENIINHCSRQLIGSLEIGNYSFLNGCGTGLGYCSLIAIIEVIKKCLQHETDIFVLIRSQNSLQYRLTNVNIVTNLC